jgi:ATP-dependent Clp protease ATP-binding subunit ClpB
MTYENFTVSAQDAILKGQRMAAGLNQENVSSSHLLVGILDTEDVAVAALFKQLSINLPLLKRELYNHIEKLPKIKSVEKQKLTADANATLVNAKAASKEMGDQFITPEIMVLGMIDVEDPSAVLLRGLGVTKESLKAAITSVRAGKVVTDQANATPLQNLEKYAINLNQKCIDGKLNKIVGRDEEIRRIIHILSRQTKNNPILVGDTGVGKASIVEGIAWRIVNKDVPSNLLEKKIYSLDLSSIVAGAKYKGEFEERLKFILDDIKMAQGEIILFMEDIHTLVGAGGGNGAMDAAGIIKPALSRGELFAIGTTSPDEYQKYFESDKTLASKFQNVTVEEPTIEESISILRGIQSRFEAFHGISIHDDALKAAAELSSRYITDRKLPEKAIDLIDEAAAKLSLELKSMPDDLDEIRRKIEQLNNEKLTLEKEGNANKVEVLTKNISELSSSLDSKLKTWEIEKALFGKISEATKSMTDIQSKIDEATKNNQPTENLQNQLEVLSKGKAALLGELNTIPAENRHTSGGVSSDDIAKVISKVTGVPVTKMMQSDKERLLNLEEELGKRIIGQKEAVIAVCDAVRRSRAGLQDPNKPIGSFIFLGPTGVGKTELAKALAEVLFDDENAITRIDMSEYQEKHSVSRLVGAPPGYVGYDEGGQLTEAVRRRPYTIVLLDEIEKAHPDTFNILLQLLDDGRLTDNKGRVANFRNTIVIMTSNLGSDKILENFEDLEELGDKHKQDIIDTTKEEVLEVLKENLRPEFLNRIDEKIVFTPLSKEEIKKIATLMLKKVKKNLSVQNMAIEFTDNAMNLLVDMGYDPVFGARPLKRVIDKELVNHMAKAILGGNFKEGDTIYVGTNKEGFTFTNTKPVEEAPTKVEPKKSEKSDQVKELEKATKDVQTAMKDYNETQANGGKGEEKDQDKK